MVDQVVSVALDYCYQVADGKKKACHWVKRACQRHLDDLEKADNDPDYKYYFDESEAQLVIDFFQILKHSKGIHAGKPFHLSDWQIFIIAVFFGWRKKANGYRRFKTAYIEVPRKNGKSTLLAGIALYLLLMDGEPSAEVYSAATKKDQALAVWEEARRMVKASKALRKRIKVWRSSLTYEKNYSKFDPLSADANTLDGLNVSGAIVDELHAHKTSAIWDVLDSGTGSRVQPAIWAITTAGSNRYGICYQLRDDCTKILDQIWEDDSIFCVIYTIDGDGSGSLDKKTGIMADDWQDPKVWEKANPNWGISVEPEGMADQAAKARRIPSQYSNFLTKRLNVWVNSVESWANITRWKACQSHFTLDDLKGRDCWGGLDLASNLDLCALRFVFPMDNGKIRMIGRAYCPEESIDERSKVDSVPYRTWVDQGYLIATPGATTDYNFIKKDILDFCENFNLKALAFDRWNSSQLINDLQDKEVPVVAMGQGFASMSAPMNELERLYINGDIEHDGDPVMDWAMSNMTSRTDESGNIKPDKKRSSEKIDPAVAQIMAIGAYLLDETEPEAPGLIDLDDMPADSDAD